MAGYIGSKVAVVSSGAERKKVFTATSGQTSFTGLSYTVNNVHVFQNGVRLVDGTDYTATNGNSITLTVGAATDDQVVVVSYNTFQTSDTVSASTGGTFAGDVNFTGSFTSQGIDDNATATAMTLDASGNVGIGVVPESWGSAFPSALQVGAAASITTSGGDNARLLGNVWYDGSNYKRITSGFAHQYEQTGGTHRWSYAATGAADSTISFSEAMRLDASGNLLVGKTSSDATTTGFEAQGNGQTIIGRTNGTPLKVNRLSSDGDIAHFRKNGSTVGVIGVTNDDIYHGTGATGLKYYNAGNAIHPYNTSSNTNRDNAIDLGMSTIRFDDIYATNGTIQTSDRNEKQDIAELSDAEQRVAVAAKGLMRKFRWRDAVEAKGNDARTHFGIIAQDLQAAFTAEGLDAGDYAMFISTTWWETQAEVPAVEAVAEVLDEDGNVVTEAVEAVDAYTRTDTYDTQEEAPEGATERTRLGVRYSELLAFIIGAL